MEAWFRARGCPRGAALTLVPSKPISRFIYGPGGEKRVAAPPQAAAGVTGDNYRQSLMEALKVRVCVCLTAL